MREICTSGSMSGEWKRSMAELVRHRQTKEPEIDRLRLNHRATPRLYLDGSHAQPIVHDTPLVSPRRHRPATAALQVTRERVITRGAHSGVEASAFPKKFSPIIAVHNGLFGECQRCRAHGRYRLYLVQRREIPR